MANYEEKKQPQADRSSGSESRANEEQRSKDKQKSQQKEAEQSEAQRTAGSRPGMDADWQPQNQSEAQDYKTNEYPKKPAEFQNRPTHSSEDMPNDTRI